MFTYVTVVTCQLRVMAPVEEGFGNNAVNGSVRQRELKQDRKAKKDMDKKEEPRVTLPRWQGMR